MQGAADEQNGMSALPQQRPRKWTPANGHVRLRTCAPHKLMSVLGQKRTSAVNCGVRYSPESKHCSYFALAQTHSSRKRERSSILIFCCSIRFSHSRIFSALSTGIIFSGAVAFMRSVTCADAACARNIAKVIGTENSVQTVRVHEVSHSSSAK